MSIAGWCCSSRAPSAVMVAQGWNPLFDLRSLGSLPRSRRWDRLGLVSMPMERLEPHHER